MPYNLADGQVSLKRCRIGRTQYGSCYQQDNNRFVQQQLDIVSDAAKDTDTYNISCGKVTLTAIDIHALGQDVHSAEFEI